MAAVLFFFEKHGFFTVKYLAECEGMHYNMI